MALQKDTVSVNIAQSLDQKTDSKLIQPNRVASLKNRRFRKVGTTDKRPGQLALSQTVSSTFPSPLPIVASNSPSSLVAHEDQLLLQNNGAAYSRQGSQWQFLNHMVNASVSKTTIAAAKGNYTYSDSATVNGVTLTAYSRTESTGTGAVAFTLVDEATGSFIVNDQTLSPTYAATLRVLAFSNSFLVMFDDISSTSLNAISVNAATGATSSVFTIRNDYNNNFLVFDAQVLSTSPLGECAVFAYHSLTPDFKVGFVTAAGTVLASPGILSTGIQPNSSNGGITGILSVLVNESIANNKFHLAWQGSTGLMSAAWTFTTSAFTASYAPLLFHATTSVVMNTLVQVLHPTDTTKICLFYSDQTYERNQLNLTWDYATYWATITTGGVVSSAGSLFSKSLSVAAYPIRDTTRGTIYLPCVHISPLQGTVFLCDVMRGAKNQNPYIVAKFAAGEVATNVRPSRTTEVVPGSGRYAFSGAFQSGLIDSQTLFNKSGIARYSIDLKPDQSAQASYAGGTSHLSGGFMWSYDGATLAENNFFIYPEMVQTWVGAAFQVSSGGGFTYVLCGPGMAINPSAGPSYVSVVNSGTTYFWWFTRDGVGTQPAASGNPLRVDILSTDTSQEVAAKMSRAATNAGLGFIAAAATIPDGGSTVSTQNSAVIKGFARLILFSSVTSVTLTGLNNTISPLPAGSYQASIVFSWVDRFGNKHRSAPSVPCVFNTSGSQQGFIMWFAPPITNRDVTSVFSEVYLTDTNGSVQHLINSQPWVANTSRYTYQNLGGVSAGTTISQRETIYTAGSVLENYQIPNCRLVSNFKGRVTAVSADEPNKLFISKEPLNGEAVEFSDSIFLTVPTSAGEIVAAIELDEKQVMFTEDSIYVSAGDPANELGTGSTLSSPADVSTDTGCRDPNSVVQYPDGILFKTAKGIYRLDRSLQVTYIGLAVEDYNANIVSKAVLDKTNNEIRFYHSDVSDLLVYNYLQDKWSIWTNSQADDACVYMNAVHRVDQNGKVHKSIEGVFTDTDGASNFVSSEVELPWMKMKGLQDFQRITMFSLLGEYASPHNLIITMFYDYDLNVSRSVTRDSSFADPVYQLAIKPEIQKCEAIKIKISETPTAGSGESAKWTDVSFDVGLKRGINKMKSGKRA